MEKKAFKRINLLSMFFQFGCNVDTKQHMSDILVVSIVGCTIKIAPMYNFSEKYEVFQQFKKCFYSNFLSNIVIFHRYYVYACLYIYLYLSMHIIYIYIYL